jgi:anaerobic ribonucleoside-triphosphate reductase
MKFCRSCHGNIERLTHFICIACIEEKPVDEFSRDNSRATGYSSYCRTCRRTQALEYRDRKMHKQCAEFDLNIEENRDRY